MHLVKYQNFKGPKWKNCYYCRKILHWWSLFHQSHKNEVSRERAVAKVMANENIIHNPLANLANLENDYLCSVWCWASSSCYLIEEPHKTSNSLPLVLNSYLHFICNSSKCFLSLKLAYAASSGLNQFVQPTDICYSP